MCNLLQWNFWFVRASGTRGVYTAKSSSRHSWIHCIYHPPPKKNHCVDHLPHRNTLLKPDFPNMQTRLVSHVGKWFAQERVNLYHDLWLVSVTDSEIGKLLFIDLFLQRLGRMVQLPVAGLGRGDSLLTPQSHFYAVFGKVPSRVGTTPFGKSWIRHWICHCKPTTGHPPKIVK